MLKKKKKMVLSFEAAHYMIFYFTLSIKSLYVGVLSSMKLCTQVVCNQEYQLEHCKIYISCSTRM